jgi:cytoskeletal protein RodZ
MALTGHLSDLSLSELIEFFCNQRKSGRLKVLYPQGAGYFFLQAGSVVDARIGVLHGIDAVYYALTLPNAQFEFSADMEAKSRTINQPWTQVVLEGLRRLDENIAPSVAFPPSYETEPDELAGAPVEVEVESEVEKSFAPAFLSFGKDQVSRRKPVFIGAIAVAILGSVAVIGVPAGWYSSKKPAAPPEIASQAPAAPQNTQVDTPAQPQPSAEPEPSGEDAAALAAKRQREKERKAREAKNAENPTAVASTAEAEKPGAKRVVVTVTYDESGRVTQASGGDANALRIARQKRFPPGKAGSATVSIPLN